MAIPTNERREIHIDVMPQPGQGIEHHPGSEHEIKHQNSEGKAVQSPESAPQAHTPGNLESISGAAVNKNSEAPQAKVESTEQIKAKLGDFLSGRGDAALLLQDIRSDAQGPEQNP